jgi:hypothetical protein
MRLATPDTRVVQIVRRGGIAAARTLCLPRGKILRPYRVIERDKFAVVDFRVHPDKGLLLAQQDALEPIALDLRHVAYQAWSDKFDVATGRRLRSASSNPSHLSRRVTL